MLFRREAKLAKAEADKRGLKSSGTDAQGRFWSPSLDEPVVDNNVIEEHLPKIA